MHAEKIKNECRKCGLCCRKGGPALHKKDIDLIRSDAISLDQVFTIRKGELAFDNVKSRLEPTVSDIIKIKGSGLTWQCLFLDAANNICTIYDRRPLECQALNCEDPRESIALYQDNLLERKDIIGHIDGLWNLVLDHQAQCDLAHIPYNYQDNDESTLRKINKIIHFDKHVRAAYHEKSNITADITEFLFGRPVELVLKQKL